MGDRGHSDPGLFGGYNHYDKSGKKTGRSEPSLFGGYTNYDAKGNKVGHSDPGLFGGINHYDNHGHKVGHSEPGLFGGYTHYDANGQKTGHSDPGLFGGYSNSSGEGCYIATCVYGSYDCPEVWVLRRFRDHALAGNPLGRAFIRCYYALSPALVRQVGDAPWFRSFWRRHLDHLVARLRQRSYSDLPYRDCGRSCRRSSAKTPQPGGEGANCHLSDN